MKKRILTALTIFLVISAGLNFVTAQNVTNETNTAETEPIMETRSVEESETKNRIGENVTSLHSGYYNVAFDDGYNGFCVNHRLHSTSGGENFTVKETSTITSNIYEGESVGNYLKILFTEFHNHTMNPDTNIAQAVWDFTDDEYKTNNDPIVQKIIEMHNNGLIVNDHGEVRRINNTTEALFDFEALDSHNDNTQNFFGYKITYRDIIEIIENNTLLGTPENNSSSNQTTIENSTQENDTILNQTPSENTTDELINQTQDNLNVDEIQKSNLKANNTTAGVEKQDPEKPNVSESLINHATGNPVFALLAILLFSTCILKIRRD